MNLNNFTIKAQETVAQAQQLAFNHQNLNIETPHVLKALLDDENGPVSYLLKKNNVNIAHLETKVQEFINRLPKGGNGEAPQNISRELNTATLKAGAALKTFGDEFVSVEHLLIGLLSVNDETAKLLKD